VIIKQLLL